MEMDCGRRISIHMIMDIAIGFENHYRLYWNTYITYVLHVLLIWNDNEVDVNYDCIYQGDVKWWHLAMSLVRIYIEDFGWQFSCVSTVDQLGFDGSNAQE